MITLAATLIVIVISVYAGIIALVAAAAVVHAIEDGFRWLVRSN